ncbi:MAG: hypothetical protein AAFW64_03885 [Pseudomonadota bacterium]
MIKALIFAVFVGVVGLSIGMLAWQTDFADNEASSRFVPPVPKPDHAGVPQSVTDRAPLPARVIASVQAFFQGGEPPAEKPTVNRGGFQQRDNFDIRYTRRPGD